jgi:type II secretory pathway pseudopilin PulG
MHFFHRHKKRQNRKTAASASGGFSIIELSIILAILAFVVVNALVVTQTRQDLEKNNDTYADLTDLKEAIGNYALRHGRFPCPSSPKVAFFDNDIGNEATRMLDRPAPSADRRVGCLTEEDAGGAANGIVRVNLGIDNPNLFVDFDDIVVGTVPTKTLDLPSTAMLDEFGNRITYAVMERLTTEENFYSSLTGNIIVLSNDGNLSNQALFVLVSHGANGIGAWPFEGGAGAARLPSPVPDLYDENENHNHHLDTSGDAWDRIFFKATRPAENFNGNMMVYDDIVIWADELDMEQLVNLPFEPDQVAGLTLWLDANSGECSIDESVAIDSDCIETTTSNVLEWRNKIRSFNNPIPFIAAQASTPPTTVDAGVGSSDFGTAGPAVRFGDGDTAVLEVAHDSGSGEWPTDLSGITIFMVMTSRDDDPPSGKVFLEKSNGADTTGWGVGTIGVTNNTRGMWADGKAGSTAADYLSGGDFFNTPRILTARYDDDFFTFGLMQFWDGCTELANQSAATIANFNNTDGLPLLIGGTDVSGGGSLEGDVGEIVIYREPLSERTREKVIKQLGEKWNITNNISAGDCTAEETPPVCVGQGLGGACVADGDCCTGGCSAGNTCCIAPGYLESEQKCSSNSDCCTGTCSIFGFCWVAS